jgi:hypothetical protein
MKKYDLSVQYFADIECLGGVVRNKFIMNDLITVEVPDKRALKRLVKLRSEDLALEIDIDETVKVFIEKNGFSIRIMSIHPAKVLE